MTNKQIVEKMYEVIFNGHDLSRAGEFIKEDYIQHNPGVKTGLDGFISAFESHFKKQPNFKVEIKRMIAEDDFVMVHLHAIGAPGEVGAAVVDIYRLEDGKMAEHWDVLRTIPTEFANNNGMF